MGFDYCAVFGCSHERGIRGQCTVFFRFPNEQPWRSEWIKVCRRAGLDKHGKPDLNKSWTPTSSSRICACHFSNPPNPRSRRKGWNHVIPDQDLPQIKTVTPRTTKRAHNRSPLLDYVQRHRGKRRKTLHFDIDIEEESPRATTETVQERDESDTEDLLEMPGTPSTPSNQEGEDTDTDTDDLLEMPSTPSTPTNREQPMQSSEKGPDRDFTWHDHDYVRTKRIGRVPEQFDTMQNFLPEFREFWDSYKENVDKASMLDALVEKGQLLMLDRVQSDDKLFQYYTGFPNYRVFKALFDYMSTKACDMRYVRQSGKSHFNDQFKSKPGKKRTLSLEEEFFSTLVRLKLGLPSLDCARRFGISESVYSDIFNTWVILLSQELEAICKMPSTEKTREHLADCFSDFKTVRVVINCTELFSQTPTALDAHKQYYSSYKHHCTVKFMVDISPGGAVVYISDMWGGRASDKHITN